MNSPGRFDGLIGASFGGTVWRYDRLKWANAAPALDSIQFSAWFGGSDASYSPTAPQTIYFSGLTVWAR